MNVYLLALAVWRLAYGRDADVDSIERKTFLLAHTGQDVTMYQAHVHARSKIDCVRTCRLFSHCTSFVFKKSSGDCYLNPNITSGGDRSLYLYEDPAPLCDRQTAPQANNGTVRVWRQTLTSLDGDVTCNGDFMAGPQSSPVQVHCTDSGMWQSDGQCLQYIFRNTSFQRFQIPRPVKEGWSLCIEGTPTARVRFTVDLQVDSNNWALHSDYRISYFNEANITVLNTYQNSTFGSRRVVNSLPILVNQPFRLQIGVKRNDTFEIQIDGNFYANLTSTSPLPLQVAFVNIYNNVSIQLVNLWCTP